MLRDNSQAIRFNRDRLWDKIHACWLGKNIGGTMGAPIEGIRSIGNLTGFTSDGLMVNDDLDLQLVWLRAVDEMGIEGINAQVLGEYWLSYVGPWWSEYGIGKRNMLEGMLPPMSGDAFNMWRHSNGAWIRTEVWACLCPGMPEKAARLAFEDACVDHGLGEGTWAAIMVAAMESAAFVINDMRTLLEIGLSKIPADCRVARAVKVAMDSFDSGIPWQEARQRVVEDSEDLGWFQAPGNIGFLAIGLLYGKGDFRQTVLTAINCGDDTDCTGATAGSIMGIAYGASHIPQKWLDFASDDLKVGCVVGGHGCWPESCTELTESVMRLMPATIRSTITDMRVPGLPVPYSRSDLDVEVWNGEDDFSKLDPVRFHGSRFLEKIEAIARRSACAIRQCNTFAELWVEFDAEPRIAPGGTLTGRISVADRRMPEQKWYRTNWFCPEGWTVEGVKNIDSNARNPMFWDADVPQKPTVEEQIVFPFSTVEFTIQAGEAVAANNRLVLEVTCVGRCGPLYVPVVVMG